VADRRRAARAAGAAYPHRARGGQAAGSRPASGPTRAGGWVQGLRQRNDAALPQGALDRGRHPDL
ncbi:MAG: hypothetical protein AVDCRST_MAG59-799, partial [uncultured Thermomicrobiales bacterium]